MTMMTMPMMNQADALSFEGLVGMAMRIIDAPRPTPPAWMIAPNFRSDEPVSVREPQADYRAAPTGDNTPYRSVREVPRRP